jgi:hypothetical protein
VEGFTDKYLRISDNKKTQDYITGHFCIMS